MDTNMLSNHFSETSIKLNEKDDDGVTPFMIAYKRIKDASLGRPSAFLAPL